VVHLSTKSEYAIKALVRLALADGDAPVQARAISEYAAIPVKFLEQVMHDLRQGGLVRSRRGKGIDGSHGGKGRMSGGDQAEPLVAPVWSEVRACTRAILRSASIADAAARSSETPMYYI
jgi:DNA-binding IscR family transcriptional regulator